MKNKTRSLLLILSVSLCVNISGLYAFDLFGLFNSGNSFNYPEPPKEGQKDYFIISENGKAQCCLVIPSKSHADENAAAKLLQTYFKIASGADCEIYKENEILNIEKKGLPVAPNKIYLGQTEISRKVELPPATLEYGTAKFPNVDGFTIKTLDQNTLIIKGLRTKATYFGAVGLLKKYLGIRRYWPTEPGGIGDVIPKNPDLKIPQIEWKDWPYFIHRYFGLTHCANKRPMYFVDFWRLDPYTIPKGEAYGKLMDPRKYADEPDLFPLINGKRQVPTCKDQRPDEGWQPCVSNPRVADIMANSIKDYFRKNPDKFALNFGVNDGYGDCTCEKCCAMDAPGADYINRIGLSDRYIKFDNKVAEIVAKEFPDKILSFIVYGSLYIPPTTATPHPMLLAQVCAGKNFFQQWDEWRKIVGNDRPMGTYFYHDDMWFIMPKVDIRQSVKRIRYALRNGPVCQFYEEFYGIFQIDGMVAYIQNELLWDPRLNENALLDEYYDNFFGTANKQMKSFYELLENDYHIWLEKYGIPYSKGKDIMSYSQAKSFQQFSVLSIETAVKCQKMLLAAMEEAKNDAIVVGRIKLVKSFFDFAVLGAKAYWRTQNLKNIKIESMDDVKKIIEEARDAISDSSSLADYKYDVIEKPEIKAYHFHPASDRFYQSLKRGEVCAEILSEIAASFSRISCYLNQQLGPQKTMEWWDEFSTAEKCPEIQSLSKFACYEAFGNNLTNMVIDPSFEGRGRKAFASVNNEDVSMPDALEIMSYKGANVWTGGGTCPMKCSFTNKDAHTGKYSFVFWSTQHAGICESIYPKDGDCVKMSVWVKHNEYKGKYKISAFPRHGKQQLTLSAYTVDVPWKPNEWQKLELMFIVQKGTERLDLWVYVDAQAPNAKVWVDDFFIAKCHN